MILQDEVRGKILASRSLRILAINELIAFVGCSPLAVRALQRDSGLRHLRLLIPPGRTVKTFRDLAVCECFTAFSTVQNPSRHIWSTPWCLRGPVRPDGFTMNYLDFADHTGTALEPSRQAPQAAATRTPRSGCRRLQTPNGCLCYVKAKKGRNVAFISCFSQRLRQCARPG
jgi:hypothetical protein